MSISDTIPRTRENQECGADYGYHSKDQFTHYRATEDKYEVLNPSYPKETCSNEPTTTNHTTILMRHP